ncbi:MAG: prolipoprotein diacylglyceryl transferase family protein [Candidatus Brachytrichaceae bacterium NZ_4S206]|jgi:prolipoprotein diacylglyceryltransferase
MLPQFVSLGPFTLNLYTLLIALAVLAPLAWAWLQTRNGYVVVSAFVVALFALAFGRAGYVALHWEYFRERTGEIFSLAGLSEHGVIVGGAIAYCVLRLASCVPCLSQFFPRSWLAVGFAGSGIGTIFNSQFLILAGIAASIGCIPNGCAYGREVFWQTDGEHSLAWRLHADWPDAYSISNPRWPTQAFMALWLAAVSASWAALKRRRRETKGRGDEGTGGRWVPLVTMSPIAFVILCFAAGDFLIQFLRGDPAPMFAGLRIYQWLDLALLAFAAAIFALAAKRVH